MKARYMYILLCSSLYGDFTSEDLHASFWANYNGFNKKPAAAFEWYKKHLCRQHLPGYMYRGLLHLFKQTHNLQQVISLMPLVEDAFTNDIEMQMIFVHALEQTGAHDAADARILNLISKIPDHQELTLQAAQTYLRRKEPENALKTVDDYLAHAHGNLHTFIFYFLKAQIYLALEKKEAALAELQKCLDIHPDFDKAWLLYGLLHEQAGNIKKAIKGYQMFLQLNPHASGHIQEHLLRLRLKQKKI